MNPEIIERIAAAVSEGDCFSVATDESLKLAEAGLGFKIPELLARIYLHVANGGFGPGYGIIGVAGGHRSDLGTLLDTFNEVRKAAKYLCIKWDPMLLPFCGWGDNIFACVDCAGNDHVIFRSDECLTQPLNFNLSDFFEIWLDGGDVLGAGRARKFAHIVNPFTGKKTRVTSEK